MDEPRLSRCKNRKLSCQSEKKNQDSLAYCIDILPEEILIAILSCLSIKEAASTSVLSRKWRYLWRFTSGTVDLGPRYFELLMANVDVDYGKLATQTVSMVDQIVKFHRGPSLDKFIVRCDGMPCPNKRPTRTILKWVRFAMQKHVRVFTLEASNQYFPDLVTFLSMSRAVISEKPHSDCVGGGFSLLRSFSLSKVNIKDEMIEYLLSNCLLLEHLSIVYTHTLRNLNLVGSKSLKSLIICSCMGLRCLTVSAANLNSFVYGAESHRKPVNLQLKDVPHLLEVQFAGKLCVSFLVKSHRHSHYCRQLEKLVLDVPVGDVSRATHSFLPLPQLQSLKELVLILRTYPGRSLNFFTLLITACPLLSRFVVKFRYEHFPYVHMKVDEPASCPRADLVGYHHQYLRVVKLSEFACYGTNLEFALALLGIAKSLEKMIISNRKELEICPVLGYYRMTPKHAKKLEAKLPHGAELVIL